MNPDVLINIFTDDIEVIEKGILPLRLIVMFITLSGFPIIGSAFFQAIGKARPSMIITLSRDFFFFIPAIIILPRIFGLIGAWITWPITDLCAFFITIVFLAKEIKIINREMVAEGGKIS
jgi:Na+-driven multidrug efflux pump